MIKLIDFTDIVTWAAVWLYDGFESDTSEDMKEYKINGSTFKMMNHVEWMEATRRMVRRRTYPNNYDDWILICWQATFSEFSRGDLYDYYSSH